MKKYKTGLVIIDMQLHFKAAHNKHVIKNVVKEIEAAITAEMPIFILEYSGNGDTHETILKALYDYEDKHFITKHHDSGSLVLMNYLNDKLIDVNEFLVCGVNTCACVSRTIQGLIEKHDKIVTVIDRACNCITRTHNHRHG